MPILGLLCEKEKLVWAVLDGSTRGNAQLISSGTTGLPKDEREKQLLWLYKEVLEMTTSQRTSIIALSEAETGQTARTTTLERAQMDGVVMAAAGQAEIPLQRYKWATIRSRFKIGRKEAVLAHVNALPLTSNVPKNRHVPIIVCLASLAE